MYIFFTKAYMDAQGLLENVNSFSCLFSGVADFGVIS